MATLASDVLGRVGRWPLLLRPSESVQRIVKFRFAGPRPPGALGDHDPRAIVGVRGAPEADPRLIALGFRFDEARQSRRPSDQDHQQAGGKRIERAGVPDRTGTQLSANHGHYVV